MIGTFFKTEHRLHKSRGHKTYFQPRLKQEVAAYLNDSHLIKWTHAKEAHPCWCCRLLSDPSAVEAVWASVCTCETEQDIMYSQGLQSWPYWWCPSDSSVFSYHPHTIQTQEHSLCAVSLHRHTHTVHLEPQPQHVPSGLNKSRWKEHLHSGNMSQFPQGKTAPIRHRSHVCRKKKKLFHASRLTSRPLQNYPPQPQGRDCWERNQLIAAPCCYPGLGSVSLSAQIVNAFRRTVAEGLQSARNCPFNVKSSCQADDITKDKTFTDH